MQQADHSSISSNRLELARKLYREHYACCFWHMKPDLDITEATIPTIIRELRRYGGQRGMMAAAELKEKRA